MPAPRVIPDHHEKYIRGTPKGSVVQSVRFFLCNLTFTVQKAINIEVYRVYGTTRAIKHAYDKRPAVEYDFLVNNLHKIIKYPDRIYENKRSKRGDYCFVKNMDDNNYLCSLELVDNVDEGEPTICLEIASLFRLKKEKYLNTYTLLWSWRDDNSPSS